MQKERKVTYDMSKVLYPYSLKFRTIETRITLRTLNWVRLDWVRLGVAKLKYNRYKS